MTFNGIIREYPGVVVDEFSTHTQKEGKAFFLSHAHSDHMRGLKDVKFANFLSLSGSKLYTTDVTKAILSSVQELTPVLKHTESITVNCPFKINLGINGEVLVTPLQSGHCSGAVMFLFEGSNGNVLYTGDFRLAVDDLRETRIFRGGGVDDTKNINTLYLDTTFCHSAAETFIPREISRDLLISKICQWLDEDKDNKICLNFPCLGYEHIILYLKQNLGVKLNIENTNLKAQYQSIPLLRDAITTDVSRVGVVSSFQKEDKSAKILNIKLSAQFFVRNRRVKEECVYFEKFNFWRIQHSNHCSFSELRDFVKILKPNIIIPIVIPVLSSSVYEAVGRLKHLLQPISPTADISPWIEDIIPPDKAKKMTSLKRVRAQMLELESESMLIPSTKRKSKSNQEMPASTKEQSTNL